MPGFKITGQESGQLPTNTSEVARKYRFLFTALGPSDLTQIAFYCQKCARPQFEADRVVIHHGQDEIYVPGKQRWLPIEVTMYEPVNGYDQTANAVYNWYAKSMINIANSVQGQQADYKKTCTLQMTDGFDQPIWIYNLYDVWISKVSPSELSYSDSELAELTFTIEIGKVQEAPGSSSGGSTSGGC